MKLTFRQASVSDAALLIELYNKSFHSDYIRYGTCPGYGRTVEQMESSVKKYPKNIFLCGDEPVGVLSAHDDGSGNIDVGCLCVIPEYQRRGIGTYIMKQLECIYPDWKSIKLITPADKKENICFYTEKCGLSIMGNMYDGDVSVVKLLKNRGSKPLGDMSLTELWQLFPIILGEHDNDWNSWYKDERKLLEDMLPMEKIVRIEHIGSTSIGTIYAKPIVDILVEVCDNVKINDIAPFITDCEYILMSESDWRMSFNKGYTREGFADRVYHLHLRALNDNDELYFRDYLIENPAIAHDYEMLKMDLIKQYQHNRDAYTAAKTDFVKQYTDCAKKFYKERYQNELFYNKN